MIKIPHLFRAMLWLFIYVLVANPQYTLGQEAQPDSLAGYFDEIVVNGHPAGNAAIRSASNADFCRGHPDL